MELEFGQEAYSSDFDGFMRYYLTVKTGEIPKVGDVYEAFKNHASQPAVDDAGVEAVVRDVRKFGRYFCAMALGQASESDLKLAFHDLRELKVDVAYPFLLELYQDYAGGDLAVAELLAAVRLVESYVFRKAICAIPTNSLNKTFATAGKSLLMERCVESIEAHFLLLPSYRRFPDDDEFQRNLRSRDLYNLRSRSYWLRRLENQGRKERVPVDEYTIEHILPQNPHLSAEWRDALGPEWQRVQEQRLHTLGNLTLTGYNSEYSDRPFLEKRDMEGGFKNSPLRLNDGLGVSSVGMRPRFRRGRLTWQRQALHRLQGGDQLRRCRAASDAACPLAQHIPASTRGSERPLRRRIAAWPLGQRRRRVGARIGRPASLCGRADQAGAGAAARQRRRCVGVTPDSAFRRARLIVVVPRRRRTMTARVQSMILVTASTASSSYPTLCALDAGAPLDALAPPGTGQSHQYQRVRCSLAEKHRALQGILAALAAAFRSHAIQSRGLDAVAASSALIRHCPPRSQWNTPPRSCRCPSPKCHDRASCCRRPATYHQSDAHADDPRRVDAVHG